MTPGLSGSSFPQAMVNQAPRFDGQRRKRNRRGRREQQVIGKAGIIRPDKRRKAKYL